MASLPMNIALALKLYRPPYQSKEEKRALALELEQKKKLVAKTTGPVDVSATIGAQVPLGRIPIGTLIHTIETNPGQGGKLARARGSFAKVMRVREDDKRKVIVRLPSGEDKDFDYRCRATVGPLTNPNYVKPKMYKAGQNRLRGIRPHVRGIAKNPVDHPHGGKGNGGHPKTPWGKPTRGYKTVRGKRKLLKMKMKIKNRS